MPNTNPASISLVVVAFSCMSWKQGIHMVAPVLFVHVTSQCWLPVESPDGVDLG